jgi:hypothetical protein
MLSHVKNISVFQIQYFEMKKSHYFDLSRRSNYWSFLIGFDWKVGPSFDFLTNTISQLRCQTSVLKIDLRIGVNSILRDLALIIYSCFTLFLCTPSFTDLESQVKRRFFLVNFDHFWSELHFFVAAGAVAKIGSSLKSNHYKQI